MITEYIKFHELNKKYLGQNKKKKMMISIRYMISH